MKAREIIEKLQQCDAETTAEDWAGDEIVAVVKNDKDGRVSFVTDADDIPALGAEWTVVE